MQTGALICFTIWFCIVQNITTRTYLVETESDKVHGFKPSGKNKSGHGSDFENSNSLRGDRKKPKIRVESSKVPCTLWSGWGEWSGSRCGTQRRSQECTCTETTPPDKCQWNGQGEARPGSCLRKIGNRRGRSKMPCSLWSEWGEWSGDNSCGSQQTHRKKCRCDSSIPPDECITGEIWEPRHGECIGKVSEHGSDYGNPKRYGGVKPEPAPKKVSCKWGEWSKWGGGNGCGEQESRGRFCKCSDGSYGEPVRCGGGSTTEERSTPCEEKTKSTPKPYHKKKRRM